jgi:tRNA-splicing ligase RtcB
VEPIQCSGFKYGFALIPVSMGNSKLRSRDFKSIGFVDTTIKSMAVEILSKHFKHSTREEKLDQLIRVANEPEQFRSDSIWGPFIRKMFPPIKKVSKEHILLDNPTIYPVVGKQFIEPNTFKQMDEVMRLPVVVKGALMPDSHQGYGLPIGGVVATQNSVIPFAVGMDIGCRMALSILDGGENFIKRYQHQIKMAIHEHTHFGIEGGLEIRSDHEVMDRFEFKEHPLLKSLHGKAWRQLGSSGSGNHFVEFGIVSLVSENPFELAAGNYLGLLSHSGSRGLGAAIAQNYTQLAMQECRLPKHVKSMAWLDLNSEPGMEYWLAMNLAGDYAKANHDCIHRRLAKSLGLHVHAKVENHHNFAWKESLYGNEMVVHRKGATPASKGQLGIIPGSMASPGYIVEGIGNESTLNSASHGAGRLLSRSKAKEVSTMSLLKKKMSELGIVLIGGSTEEAPGAYKNIDEILDAQKHLVQVKGMFHPKLVRMNKE